MTTQAARTAATRSAATRTVAASDRDYQELIVLKDKAGEGLYRRLVMAQGVLHDRDWVWDPARGGGDLVAAIRKLERDCFCDLFNAIGLAEMLNVLHTYPRLEQWKKFDFDLQMMYDLMRAKEREASPKQEKVARFGFGDKVDPLKWEVQRLRRENADLRAENATLREKVRAYETGRLRADPN